MEQLACQHGHQWQVGANGIAAEHAGSRRCPVCGEPHLTVVLSSTNPNGEGEPARRSPASFAVPSYSSPPKPSGTPGSNPSIAIPGCDLLGELGRGGMGVVYKAWQPDPGRHVAVKMILAGAYAGPAQLDRFRIESEAAARLHHPNIVQLFEVGENEGRPYCLLEFVAGRSLAQHLDGTPWPVREAADLIRVLARAIHEAHQLGIVHRDLKPGNVLLGEDGIPKITDFGLAKILDGELGPTQSGDLLGTPSYIAPEQVERRGRPIGPAVDVYALGAILYELLTGRPPFKAETALDTVLQVVTADPVPVARLQPKVPRELETICMKCLEKEPRRRYTTAQDLADELERFLQHQPIRARPVGTMAHVVRWCKRNPALAVSSAAAVALLLATAILGVYTAIDKSMTAAELRRSLDEQKRLTAEGFLRHGIDLCEPGRNEPGTGLLWLGRGLELVQPHDEALQHALRTTLGTWGRTLHPLRNVQTSGGWIGAASASSDGRVFLTGGHGAIAWHWDAASMSWQGAPLFEANLVPLLALSADGSTAATARDQRHVEVWDTVSGQLQGKTLVHEIPVMILALCPQGRLLVTAGRSPEVQLWEARTGKLLRRLPHTEPISLAVFSPDNRHLLTAQESGLVLLWDTEKLKPVARLPHNALMTAAAFNPRDPSRVILGTYAGEVLFWDEANQPPQPKERHGQAIRALSVSPTGEFFCTASDDKSARAWSVATGLALSAPMQHRGSVTALALSSDGTMLLTASEDQTARLWETPTGKALGPPLAQHAQPVGVVFTPGGRSVSTATENGLLRTWQVAERQTPRRAFEHEGTTGMASYSSDGFLVVTGTDQGTLLWDAKTGERLGGPFLPEQNPYRVALSPDRKLLATVVASEDDKARVTILQIPNDKEPLAVLDLSDLPIALTFTADSKHFLAASGKQFLTWNVEAGQAENGPLIWPEGVQVAVFTPRGDRIFFSTWQTTELRDVRTGAALGPPLHHAGLPRLLASNLMGTQAAIGSNDRTARLWDPFRGVPLGRPVSHGGHVDLLALSPDGRVLLTCTELTQVQLFSPVLGVPLGPVLPHSLPVTSAVFSPDGTTLLICASESHVLVRTVPQPLDGAVERIVLTLEVHTGLTLDRDGVLHALDAEQWQQRRQRLQGMGGPLLP